MAHICAACKAKVDDAAVYCSRCGARLDSSASRFAPAPAKRHTRRNVVLATVAIALLASGISARVARRADTIPSDRPYEQSRDRSKLDSDGRHTLNAGEVQQIFGRFTFEHREGNPPGVLTAHVHNNSVWDVDELIVRVQLNDKAGRGQLDQTYRMTGNVASLADGKFETGVQFDVPRDATWAGQIVSARSKRFW